MQDRISDFRPLERSQTATRRIAVNCVMANCHQDVANQELTKRPSCLQSSRADDALEGFVAAVESNTLDINERNQAELLQLCEDFGLNGLNAQRAKLGHIASEMSARWDACLIPSWPFCRSLSLVWLLFRDHFATPASLGLQIGDEKSDP
jgi:hypothetical protein